MIGWLGIVGATWLLGIAVLGVRRYRPRNLAVGGLGWTLFLAAIWIGASLEPVSLVLLGAIAGGLMVTAHDAEVRHASP